MTDQGWLDYRWGCTCDGSGVVLVWDDNDLDPRCSIELCVCAAAPDDDEYDDLPPVVPGAYGLRRAWENVRVNGGIL